ncbi:phosphodiester glycosidase family protein [Ferruginibacter sp. SUN106]|uniref:phosphodiester glycosidase family protein n=1 Tax=Ferruginibacter sp. SUN106 TaxID=2978348 RepID=UPI003D36ACBC
MKKVFIVLLFFLFNATMLSAQQKWVNVDSAFQLLPDNFHVYKSTDSLDGKPCIAYYAEAKLKDKHLSFTADTSHDRRITPLQFYAKNKQPLLVVNCTFFSYETNRSLNVVIKDGKMAAFNTHTIPMKGKDTFQYKHPLGSAIGIDKKRNVDVAWLYTDSLKLVAYARQLVVPSYKDSSLSFPAYFDSKNVIWVSNEAAARHGDKFNTYLKKWKMKTAVGGGPVLLQNGEIKITNEEELKFTGKAIEDKHPRTCMGYTNDGRLIVMVIQGRFPGIAEGATLTQEAQLLKDLGCTEALNLDGGGSSCMLINGKETITPSDKVGERPVPAVFVIKVPQKRK